MASEDEKSRRGIQRNNGVHDQTQKSLASVARVQIRQRRISLKFRFRRFRSRILFLFITLLVLVQVIAFIVVDGASRRNARAQIASNLEIGAHVFKQLSQSRIKLLSEQTRIISMDYAFKIAFTASDRKTILSALESLKMRVNASYAILVSTDYQIVADTWNPEIFGKPFPFPQQIETAEEYGFADAIVIRGGSHFQMIIAPLPAPDPIAWFAIGYIIDEDLVKAYQELVFSHISLLRSDSDGQWTNIASTLTQPLQNDLVKTLPKTHWQPHKSLSLPMEAGEYVALLVPLQEGSSGSVYALLQRSLTEVMQPYRRLRNTLLLIFISGVLVFIAATILIASSVTKPVKTLVKSVREIEKGNYSHYALVNQQDEIGELAKAYNSMVKGLAEKERVQTLLGKVVSPAIAHELMRHDVELGGEEREVTILFSDIRNFTTLCDGQSSKFILTLLNRYLTRMSSIIESYGGVIDKYIGDAIMALFGAPLQHEDDVDRALNTAIDMCLALEEFNLELKHDGLPPLGIGIGVNTGMVTAGNMGSVKRLNYTVIGDGVNVASRLEGLTKNKRYNARIIISKATRIKATQPFETRSLGEAYVKGKPAPVAIYALSGRSSGS